MTGEEKKSSHDRMKYLLADAMKQCMKKVSVEKITVKEIVEECGTTRQTFYRNFQDKYDLINWYFDKILLESFEHMGEGRTVYEGLVNKFHYIEKEKLFFRAAFKNDAQNSLREHDFHLIMQFYTDRIEGKTGRKMTDHLRFPSGNVLSGFDLYDSSVGSGKDQLHAGADGTVSCRCHAGRAWRSIPETGAAVKCGCKKIK